MNKTTIKFTALTFCITFILSGFCIICEQFGITLENNHLLFIPYILSSFSPAIASYVVLKKSNEITGFREWIKTVFRFKTSSYFYLLAIMFSAVYFVSRFFTTGLENMNQFYLIFILLPLMLLGGGMEEAGWRYILQPALDKKYGFILSSIIVSVIWAVWHLPLFYLVGTSQYQTNFWLFAIDIVGLTFALGAIRKISNNVFLCVFFHCLHNAGSVTFNTYDTLFGNLLSMILLVTLSIIAVYFYEQKRVNVKAV